MVSLGWPNTDHIKNTKIARQLLRLTGFLLALFVLLPCTVHAQQVFGSIYGNVKDASGAVVPNAQVLIEDQDKQTRFSVTTNGSGNYTKGQLIAGRYRVTVIAPGFKTFQTTDVSVTVNEASEVNANLQTGSASEIVVVTETEPLLQTDRPDVGITLDSEDIEDYKTPGNNLAALQFIAAGTSMAGQSAAAAENPQGSFRTLINGQSFAGTGFQLDGTDNTDPILSQIVVNPNIYSVAQTKFLTQVFDAEFGFIAGGTMMTTTKSGTNTFHGSIFEFLTLNTPGFKTFGADPFTQPNGAPPAHINQFGGSIGGPILRKKLFFFADAQITRNTTVNSILTTVPTEAARTGNLSGYINNNLNHIYDPASGNATTGLGRKQFMGNDGKTPDVIPTNRLNPQALAILKYWPLPNLKPAVTPYRNNYLANGPYTFNSEQWDVRIDYFLNPKNTIFGRYTRPHFFQHADGVFGAVGGGPGFGNTFAGTGESTNQNLAVGYTHIFSPSFINETRIGFLQYRADVKPNGYGQSPAADAGIPGLNLDATFASGMPYFNISGDGGATLGYSNSVNRCNCPLQENLKQLQVIDNVTKVVGNHSFKFGLDLHFAWNIRVPSDSHRAGELTFSTGYTSQVTNASGTTTQGLGLGSFLLGGPSAFARYVGSTTNAREYQPRYFFFAQDTWRARPNLTISAGLRWELVFPERVNQVGAGSVLDLSTGLMNVFGVGNVPLDGFQKMNYKNFAPRLGIAYQFTPTTVIRAGYGWSYSLGVFGSNFAEVVTQNPPVLASQSITAPNNYTSIFSLTDGPPAATLPQPDSAGQFPLPNGISVRVRNPRMTLPLVMAYNFTVQQQITPKFTISVGFVGNQGRHALFGGNNASYNVNQASWVPGVTNQNLRKPYYGTYGWTQAINYYCGCASNNYNSLQTQALVKVARGLTLTTNFTWQKSLGDQNDSYGFMYNRALNFGNAQFLTKYQYVFAGGYDLPFGRGKQIASKVNRGVDAVIGGWRISGVTTYYSGRPFNPTINRVPGTLNGAPYVRPDVGPSTRPDKGPISPFAGARHDRTQYYTPGIGAAFLYPASGQFGNYGVNNLFGPIFINQSASVFKKFDLKEGIRFTFQASASNLFNHANLGDPNPNVTDVQAGVITATAANSTMRRMQFGSKIEF